MSHYNARHDVGVPLWWKFESAKAAGREVEAYDYLHQGAQTGSPCCMCEYGEAMVRGEIPGKAADPSGAAWLEKAVAAGFGFCRYGMLLMEGVCGPADAQRGLALCEQDADRGDALACMWLGRVYHWGLFGVRRDDDRAVQWVLKTGSWLRRLAARIGISQLDWTRRQLIGDVQEDMRLHNVDQWEQQRMRKEMIKHFKGRSAR
jgi:hypothetical protein